MKTFEDAAKTFRDFECELERLDDTYEIAKLDEIEMRSVRILQLLEAQIGSIASELYTTIKMRRADILQGKYKPVEKKAEPKAEKPAKPAKKAKKAKK